MLIDNGANVDRKKSNKSEEGVGGRCEEFCSVLGSEVSSFIIIRRLLLTGATSGGNSSKLSRDGLFLVGVGSE
jgi:hypothetical protein